MSWWPYALMGLAGGVAIEGLQLYGAIRRTGGWPWNVPGEPALPPYLASVVIRGGLGAVVAGVLAIDGQLAGAAAALGAGVGAPLLLEQLAAAAAAKPERRSEPTAEPGTAADGEDRADDVAVPGVEQRKRELLDRLGLAWPRAERHRAQVIEFLKQLEQLEQLDDPAIVRRKHELLDYIEPFVDAAERDMVRSDDLTRGSASVGRQAVRPKQGGRGGSGRSEPIRHEDAPAAKSTPPESGEDASPRHTENAYFGWSACRASDLWRSLARSTPAFGREEAE